MDDNRQMRNSRRNRRKKAKQRKGIIFPLICSLIGAAVFFTVIKLWFPSFISMSFYDYFQTSADNANIVIGDEIITDKNNAVIDNADIYFSVDFVKEKIDPYVFWDSNEKKLTITTDNHVIRMETDELTYYVNDEPMKLSIPVYEIDGIAYMPRTIIEELYNFVVNYDNESKIICIDNTKSELVTGKISSRTAVLRFLADKKSPIEKRMKKEEDVYIFGEEENNYIKVRTKEGYVGYVLKSKVETTGTKKFEQKEKEEKRQLWDKSDGKINMFFDQVTRVEANRTAMARGEAKGVNVVSPTWFSFDKTSGNIVNIADKSYVNWAHRNGWQVWALITDNFDENVCHSVISSTETREKVIKQILAFVSLYELDGINIDFEAVPKSDGEYYIQFLRELAPYLNRQGAILSVDMFVPKPWTNHYNRNEVGKIADYIVVMGYDEHYSGSKESGSVASIDWSRQAIDLTVKEGVASEKIILGMPFYTRLWTEEETDSGVNVSSKALGMEDAYNFIIEKGEEFEWLEDIGQYYAEVKENNLTYKIWLEDEKSIQGRVELALQKNTAGVAAWKRGFEKDEIWNIINNVLKENE